MSSANPKNILIINVHSTLNAGDAALLGLNIQQIQKVFSHLRINILANYPNEQDFASTSDIKVWPSPFALIQAGSAQPGWVKIFKLVYGCVLLALAKFLPARMLEKSSVAWFQMASVYRSSDMIAAVSGAQLVSLGKYGWPLLVSSIPIILAHFYNKSFYVMPQSIGPFRWRWERWLVREIYSRARVVFLRDAISMQLAKSVGLPEGKVRFAYDPGFALTGVASHDAMKIMFQYGYSPDIPAVGITVIAQLSKVFPQDQHAKYYRIIADTLTKFSQKYAARIYIFDQVRGPTASEDDSIAAETLLGMVVENRGQFVHVNRRLSPMELKACYGLMNLFIASRFHSGIFSMSSGVPTVFVGYNPKTKGFLEAVGLDQLMVDLTDLKEDQLWDLLCQTWQNRESMQERIRLIVHDCQLDFDRVSQGIAEDYFNDKKS